MLLAVVYCSFRLKKRFHYEFRMGNSRTITNNFSLAPSKIMTLLLQNFPEELLSTSFLGIID